MAEGVRVRPLRTGEHVAARRLADRAGAVYAPEGDLVLAAETHGTLAGWASGTVRGLYPGAPVPPPHGYVQAVVVGPGYRRRGVGRRLVEAFLAAAARSGVGWVFAAPDEGGGVEARVAWLVECGFVAVEEPHEVRPVMGHRVTVHGSGTLGG
ncbi:GNAT family N-acetyltransferase [Nocardiopsis alba]|uniref:GNAT family N-acetyltransferase n=1 Tax=Nocardiopsis alba TaxID=53437 RepID=UPI00366ED562